MQAGDEQNRICIKYLTYISEDKKYRCCINVFITYDLNFFVFEVSIYPINKYDEITFLTFRKSVNMFNGMIDTIKEYLTSKDFKKELNKKNNNLNK